MDNFQGFFELQSCGYHSSTPFVLSHLTTIPYVGSEVLFDFVLCSEVSKLKPTQMSLNPCMDMNV